MALALGLCTSACSGSTNSTSGSNAANALTVGAYGGPTIQRNFNPYSPNFLSGTAGLVYENLFGANPLKGGAFVPWLVTKYAFSPDGKTMTLTMDPRAKWSDGTPLTSSDVVFTADYLKKHDLAPFEYSSITAPDKGTVTIAFTQPAFGLVKDVGGLIVLPQKQWASKTDPLTDLNQNPVGSGPYTVKQFTSQQVTFGAREGYWKQTVPVKTLNFTICGDTAVQKLQTDQMQWTSCGITSIKSNYLTKNPTHHVFNAQYASRFLALNLTRKPFDNIDVRRGISLALNRGQLADLINGENPGAMQPVSPTGYDAKAWSAWLPPEHLTPVKQDVNAALQSFAKAGYRQSGGKLVGPNGKQLSIELLEVADYADSIQYARVLVEQLKKVGIDAKVKAVAENLYTSDQAAGKFDAVVSKVGYGGNPISGFRTLLASENVGKNRNWERWNDKATDNLLTQAKSAPEAEQKSISKKLGTIMAERLPLIATNTNPASTLYSTKHWTGWPDASNPYSSATPFDGLDTALTVLSLKPAQ
ncbi:hypothetical protein VV02_16685 [Luteipulveratus mongoliensis]|uniref:Solute-binding protein family 5 domain-containing protein n=1 Tax=Luteipulveratus mongoliensis TaxID=571913 RepID=A0A0K1JK62_9MICO|nr:hypothetical protein VV02_16685 [Luteipulveratus mongoliensis]